LKDQLTDVLTKSLPHAPFAHLGSKLRVESLSSAWGAYYGKDWLIVHV
jgi:hypothetical protein